MVKAIVTGVGGRMGSRILSLVAETEGIEVVGAIEQKGHPLVGSDVGASLGAGKIYVIVESDLHKCIDKGDVVIDFTNHEVSIQNIEIAAEHNKAIVIGSTGFSAEEVEKIKELSQGAKCVLSPNMSVGVNIMFKVIASVAEILGDEYDVEIVEAHHRLKKDAPSGTAMKMAQIIAETLGRDLEETGVYTRKGLIGERTRKEIGIQTIRAGDIVGEHTVMFGGIGERLEFIHRAHNRDNFARGAIRAAKWIVGQEYGLYDMQDVLGLKSWSLKST
jgi:4-hydroxy-tetrahydrodipicolinate reductase